MTASYSTALEQLRVAADDIRMVMNGPEDGECQSSSSPTLEWVPLEQVGGRIVVQSLRSPISSPPFDSSAMDGYALRSAATAEASPETPVLFRVLGTIAAGDNVASGFADPDSSGAIVSGAVRGKKIAPVDNEKFLASERQLEPCAEIMTGAPFPRTGLGECWDACVRLEDVVAVAVQGRRCIAVSKPVPANAHRRLAGHDIQAGQVLLRPGQIVKSSHILALASVGITTLPVLQRLRLGIWSTGREIVAMTKTGRGGRISEPASGAVHDVNGPYLMAASQEAGASCAFLGTLDDCLDNMADAFRMQVALGEFDVLLTTGGVSVGRFDVVRAALNRIGARVVFHGLDIRPGHPVLFALIPPLGEQKGRQRQRPAPTAFFGLPGNPGATAACFKFLVVPYLRRLGGQEPAQPIQARLLSPGSADAKNGVTNEGSKLKDLDRFSPGVLDILETGECTVVDIGRNNGPAKLAQFVSADCWIHYGSQRLPSLGERQGRQIVPCYPTSLANGG